MSRYARQLFTTAACFNLAIGISLLIGWPWLVRWLQLSPAEGSNRLIVNICAVMVLVFGYAYYMAGRDPVRNRPYIVLGAIGKLLVFAVAVPVLVTGRAGHRLAWLTVGDLLFAGLFLDFLRRQHSLPGPILGRR